MNVIHESNYILSQILRSFVFMENPPVRQSNQLKYKNHHNVKKEGLLMFVN